MHGRRSQAIVAARAGFGTRPHGCVGLPHGQIRGEHIGPERPRVNLSHLRRLDLGDVLLRDPGDVLARVEQAELGVSELHRSQQGILDAEALLEIVRLALTHAQGERLDARLPAPRQPSFPKNQGLERGGERSPAASASVSEFRTARAFSPMTQLVMKPTSSLPLPKCIP